MTFSDHIKGLLKRSREKHKLSFMNASNYHERWSLRVSALNLYTLLALYTILIMVGITLLIRYTSLKELFIDLPPMASVDQIHENTSTIDSLSADIRSRQMYLDDLHKILTKTPFKEGVYESSPDTLYSNYHPNFNKSREDSLLRFKVENEGKAAADFSYDFFFAPVKGTITKSFDKSRMHFGVDVVTEKETPIKSCLEGTVIFSGWTPNEGNVVVLQHNNNFISLYKHCSSLLKKTGEKMQTADPIAIVGNTGEHSSGPHLHFEIWKKGVPLNPQEFISFEK